VRGVDHVIHLPLEVRESAERRRIEHLDEHRAAPAFRRLGAAVARKARGQRSMSSARPNPL
jgi:hypothetical protein